MTDIQIRTVAIAIIVPVVVPLSLLIYSNSRVTEVKETLRAEIKALHVEMTARFTAIDTFLQAMMGKLDELDRRLTALEGRR
jgi:hypothetical protein